MKMIKRKNSLDLEKDEAPFEAKPDKKTKKKPQRPNRNFCRFFAAAVGLLYVYKLLLYKYGSFSPAFATLYTQDNSRGLASDSFPPNNLWRPKFRVVLSLTSTPNRLAKLEEGITSLLEQASFQPDAIYLNIPTGPMKRHPELNYDEVILPSYIQKRSISLQQYEKQGRKLQDDQWIIINRCKDYGPATKLIPTLFEEKDPTTLIVTVDDDFLYPKRLLESLTWESFHQEKVALGVCGWSTMPVPGEIGVVPVYVPYMMRPKGRVVEILQACCGNAYRRGFFHDLDLLIDIPPVCVTVDDIWLAGYLNMQENVRQVLISKRLDPDDPAWKKKEAASQFLSAVKLSNYNDANHIHYKCIQAMEEKFHRKWRRVFDK